MALYNTPKTTWIPSTAVTDSHLNNIGLNLTSLENTKTEKAPTFTEDNLIVFDAAGDAKDSGIEISFIDQDVSTTSNPVFVSTTTGGIPFGATMTSESMTILTGDALFTYKLFLPGFIITSDIVAFSGFIFQGLVDGTTWTTFSSDDISQTFFSNGSNFRWQKTGSSATVTLNYLRLT